MAQFAYHTAGESHGPQMTALVQGMPSGVAVDLELINAELRRRQGGYGRGGRQRIETDSVEVLSGVRRGLTTGAPITLAVVNRDSRLDDLERTPPVHRPRPGHADLAGSVKWLTTDCRDVLERASARETAARVAAGALGRCLLNELGITVVGFVRAIGGVATDVQVDETNITQILAERDASEVYCPDAKASEGMCAEIRQAKVDKDTVGGLVETHVFGCPIGIGSTMDWREKLDARIAMAVISIQAFKAVEFGMGKEVAAKRGSDVHDPIEFDQSKRETPSIGFVRPRNNAGGVEGGMSNGAPIVVRGAMKPISTLLQGMPSVDLNTKQAEQSSYERSDVCAVSAASVVMEHTVGLEIVWALRQKFGGDSLGEMRDNMERYLEMARLLPMAPPTQKVV
ncbi:MAG: chorismate synthase [Phycisphaerales bacterium]|nr:chorismate synthase [Phycisphaerales bacterium]